MLLKYIYTILICLGVSYTIQAQSYYKLIKKADSLYEAKNYKASKKKYLKAFQLKKDNPTHLYYGACATALAGDSINAFNMLELAISKGWLYIKHMKTDPDLKTLHNTKKWNDIISSAEKALFKKEANYNKPLQKELLLIGKDDQETRIKYVEVGKTLGWNNPKIDSLKKVILHKDSINLIKVKRILDTHGWVGKSVVGAEANSSIFMVLQHTNLATQKKYLPMLQEAVKKGNAKASSMAMMVDRIAIREGKKQIYGSQIARNPNTKEHYVVALEKPESVDLRRQKVGLSTMEDYVKHWNLKWDVKKYKEELPKYEQWLKIR